MDGSVVHVVLQPGQGMQLTSAKRDGHALETRAFVCLLDTIHGRMAARAYAYSIAPTDPRGAEHILDIVGREG